MVFFSGSSGGDEKTPEELRMAPLVDVISSRWVVESSV